LVDQPGPQNANDIVEKKMELPHSARLQREEDDLAR
jgi:hypothetical protein